ncbi:hypothetical protein ACNHKD_12560 [Methylocystis sp. JAN1]|uniref:hypothetical protein n=1 Tax=Methylocystis sp. JAN1 TaxID=3397211 RepID=UPI003FA2DEBA
MVCFDTAFHTSQPPIAQAFAIAHKYSEAGVRRFGFHGISYEYVAGRVEEIAPDIAEGRIIVAYLGNGASLCAMQNGKSVASTMGFTAADGLVMMDDQANRVADIKISTSNSTVDVYVIPTNEELEIAQSAWRTIFS